MRACGVGARVLLRPCLLLGPLGPARRRVVGEAASLRVALDDVGASDVRVWRWCAAVFEGSPTGVWLFFGCQSAGALPGVLKA